MSGLKVCVCSSYPAWAEPRAPRHAVALAKMRGVGEVLFIDCVPMGQARVPPRAFADVPNLRYQTFYYPTRAEGRVRLIAGKLRSKAARSMFATLGLLRPSALSLRAAGLEKLLAKSGADVLVGHNIDTLLPVHRVARRTGAVVIFDCMEYYSDMGDGQTLLDREIIRKAERACLADCDLILTSSEPLAEELASTYGVKNLLALHNVPPIEPELRRENGGGALSLYWRNSTIGLGQRGLGDGLAALRLLPEDITLNLQGRLPSDGGKALRRRISEMGLESRVFIHSPYEPHEAVRSAARYEVGLCLERGGIKNHDLTVSNKLFDYLMAGLAVVASDLPGLRNIVTLSGGGLLFKSGQPDDLAEKIMALYENREMLSHMGANARAFALRQANVEREMGKFRDAFAALMLRRGMGGGVPNGDRGMRSERPAS